MGKLKSLFKVLVVIMAFFCFSGFKGRVVKVADGDTITVVQDKTNKKVRIRFYGIDAPEKSQEYGKKSLSVLKNLLDNEIVEVEVKDKDQYGRIVGVVYHNNRNVNLYMLETGNVWYYKQYAKGQYDYANAEKRAKENRIGLWKDKSPTPPWQYRREQRKKNN